jgi:hypothetical protein
VGSKVVKVVVDDETHASDAILGVHFDTIVTL